MRKLIALLLVASLVALSATSALAGSELESEGLTMQGAVGNCVPEIDEGSLWIQILDGSDIAWEWEGIPTAGWRAVPYLFEGEKLGVEVEVSDLNGADDLTNMIVTVTLGAGVEFPLELASTTIDPEVGISKGHYSGELVVDGSIASGKYDLQLNATDPQGANDSHDPDIYQNPADLLLKPFIGLRVDKPSIFFPNITPGQGNISAVENPVRITPEATIEDEHIPVVFDLMLKGTDMESTSSSDVIPLGNIGWGSSATPESSIPMAGDYQVVATDIVEGTEAEIYYWLDAPVPLAFGIYEGEINYKVLAH